MSKKFNRFNDFDMHDELDYRHDHYLELKERRKNKRMRNALRARNVDDLMRDYDEY